MNIAITGATGFLGVHLIHHLLNNGHDVVAVKRPSSRLDQFNLVKEHYLLAPGHYDKLTWMDAELYDTHTLSELFENVATVIHAAGFISYNRNDRSKLKHVNHDLTASVVNACISAKVENLIYISSTAAIPKPLNTQIIESSEWDDKLDHSYYGKTKFLGQLEVYRGGQEGLHVCILNPGIILGYGDWNWGSLKLFRNAANKMPFYSKGSTGFIGVDDLCKIILQAIQKPDTWSGQYIAISENKSFEFISRTMAKELGVRGPYIHVYGLLFKFIYTVLSVKEWLGFGGMLTAETAKSSISMQYYDNSKLRSQFNGQLRPIEEVITQACDAYKKKRPT